MGHDHNSRRRSERLGIPAARQVVDAWGDLALDMADAMESFLAGVAEPAATRRQPARPHRAQRPRASGCRGCQHRSCTCDCCIPDADLLVVARAGERRVVPVLVRNERKRAREVTIELSGFTRVGGGGEAPVDAEVVGDSTFTLDGCDSREVIVVLQVGGHGGQMNSTVDQHGDRQRLGDVDACVVALADLRLSGCETRPLRIAVAIMPRSCDRYETSCGCGCC